MKKMPVQGKGGNGKGAAVWRQAMSCEVRELQGRVVILWRSSHISGVHASVQLNIAESLHSFRRDTLIHTDLRQHAIFGNWVLVAIMERSVGNYVKFTDDFSSCCKGVSIHIRKTETQRLRCLHELSFSSMHAFHALFVIIKTMVRVGTMDCPAYE